ATWRITDVNAGTLSVGDPDNVVASFDGIQNLTGGSGDDRFVFGNGVSVSGRLDGGSGTNTLDYSAYRRNVLVNLQTGLGTGGGGLASIKNVLGGSGGPAGSYNLLVGNGGNVLTGGNGRRNLLIAGGLHSTLIGGDGDDILIAGTTAYDTEAGMVSLRALMDYWAGTADDYDTRVGNLTSGTGVPLLNATTVFGNGGSNTLTGGPGRDLFFANLDLGDILADLEDCEVVLSI